MNGRKNIVIQALLFDIYGGLLTEKRRDVMEMYLNEDMSYGEIAERQGITRQGALNCVKNAEQTLENFEEILQLAERFEIAKKLIKQLNSLMDKNVFDKIAAKGILTELSDLI